MQYSLSIEDLSHIAAPQGNLTYRNYDAFRACLDSLFCKPSHSFAIDLSDVDAIDSIGLGLLLIAHSQSQKTGRLVVLRNPTQAVLHTLKDVGFDDIFPIEGSAFI